MVADADHNIGKELDSPISDNYDAASSSDPHREDKLAKLRYMDQIYKSFMESTAQMTDTKTLWSSARLMGMSYIPESAWLIWGTT